MTDDDKSRELPSSEEFHEHLVRLGSDAYDLSFHEDSEALLPTSRDLFKKLLRERMAEAATVYATALKETEEGDIPPLPGPGTSGPSEPVPWAAEAAFSRSWGALPPLVRASAAAGILGMLEKWRGALRDRQRAEAQYGLERRALVTRRFDDAYHVVAQFLAALAQKADAEAVARGIDADTVFARPASEESK